MKRENNEPFLSVSMMTYKHELYIKEAIEGVLMQKTNFEFDLIIADDCSPDKTTQIVEEIINTHPNGYRIKYFKQEKNVGMQINGIFAVQQCKGKYVALCEGDDYWTDPHKLQKQVNFLEENMEYVLCGHLVGIQNIHSQITIPEKKESKSFDQSELYRNHIPTLSVVFRNCITDFPDTFFNAPTGDFFLWVLAGRHGKYYIMSEVMANYRETLHGTWSGISRINQIKNSITTRKLASKYIFNNHDTLINIRKRAKIGLILSLKSFDMANTIFFIRYLFA